MHLFEKVSLAVLTVQLTRGACNRHSREIRSGMVESDVVGKMLLGYLVQLRRRWSDQSHHGRSGTYILPPINGTRTKEV